MIVKIKSRKNQSYRQLIEYMLHDKDRLSGKDGFIVAKNLKGNRIDSWVKQLQENEKFRKRKRKDSVIITHEILSWSKKDSISPEQMEVLTREYLKRRNIRGMYLAVPHYNRENYHVHILAAGIEYKTGKALRLSRKELADLKRGMQEFQKEKYPELIHSAVEHGRKKKGIAKEKEFQARKRTGKLSQREELFLMVESCFKNSKTQEDFFARLQGCKLQTYVRGGRIYGVVFGNRNYRFKTLGLDLATLEMRREEIEREKELDLLRQKKQSRSYER
ncbi:MAG: relaxase/mobilization nuclease domain-containing protein [Bacteroidia bacterium]